MFSLSKPSQLERDFNFQLKKFAKPSGTLKVGIFDTDTGNLVRKGKDPYTNIDYKSAPKIYLQKRLWIFPAGIKESIGNSTTLEH